MTYTDPALVSAFLKRDLTDSEQLSLSVTIPAVQKWIDRKLGTTFLPVSATSRYYDGGDGSIDLEPCTEITEIASYDSYSNADLYLYNQSGITEVLADPVNETIKNEIRLRSNCFPFGESNIRVKAKFSQYTSTDGIPEDIAQVATMLVIDFLKASNGATDNVKKESLEGHSVEYNDPNLLFGTLADGNPMIRSILELRRELVL